MTTHRNKAARASETRQEKRERLADPALDTVERQRELQANNPTLQTNMTAARKQEFENRKRELEGEIRNLRRMKDRAERGYVEAAKAGYERTYQRLTRLAQILADEFGQAVSVPSYDPPVDAMPKNVTTIQPRGAEARAADGTYRETRGMGPSGKGGPLPAFPGTDAGNAWLNVQGAQS